MQRYDKETRRMQIAGRMCGMNGLRGTEEFSTDSSRLFFRDSFIYPKNSGTVSQETAPDAYSFQCRHNHVAV
ncbi:MAG: hypothetical protein LUD00_11640 [Prevotellaceae bacterium]|nr:hypothetical protein [Prevotellaceae bacterium]